MSRVRPPQDEWSRLNDLERRINNLERSNAVQGAGITAIDASSNVRLFVGEISPGVWGLQIFDASGHELLQLDSAGLQLLATTGGDLIKLDGTGLKCFDGSGNDLIQLDTAGLHAFDTAGHELIKLDATGLKCFDSSGTDLVQLNTAGLHLLATSGTDLISLDATGLKCFDSSGTDLVLLDDAGLKVKNEAGVMQAVGGVVLAHESSPVGVSGTAGDVALGVSLTATIGASGEAFAMWAGNTDTGAGGGEIFCFVDGVASGAPPAQYSGSGSSTVGMVYLFTGLTPGSHTFALYGVAVASGDTLTMAQATLALQPL